MTNAEIVRNLVIALGIMVGLVTITNGISFLAILITKKVKERGKL